MKSLHLPSFPDLDDARDFRGMSLLEADVDGDPFVQFARWYNEVVGKTAFASAMTLATATPDGLPAARTVLLKQIDHGFVFFTNYLSRKGRELRDNPRAVLLFFWVEFDRQVRIEGRMERTSEVESDEYFLTRPHDSRIGAWASAQSEILANRMELESRIAELEKEYQGKVIPRPPFWGGYRLIPNRFEFWQGRPNRLHDRIEYLWEDGQWHLRRLAP